MRLLKNLSANNIGIIFVIAQWILLCLMLVKLTPMFDTPGHEVTWEILLLPVLVIDLPAIILAIIFWLPFYSFTGNVTAFQNAALLSGILTITFQWMLIGRLVYNFFSPAEKKLTMLSLSDV